MNLLKFECHSPKECEETEPLRKFFGQQSFETTKRLEIDKAHGWNSRDGSYPSRFVGHWYSLFNYNQSELLNWDYLVMNDELYTYSPSDKFVAIYLKLQEMFSYDYNAMKSFLTTSLKRKVSCEMDNMDFNPESQ